jgi:2,3-bisphosphoglycerate-independent phosphoglycerate mutase
MDRDKRWDRVQQAYDLWVHGSGARANSALQALEDAYDNGVTDEFIAPTALGDFAGMQDGDGLFVANFRADRVRQFLHAFTDDAFTHFVRSKTVEFSHVLGMVHYSDALAHIPAVFEPQTLTHTLGEVVAAHNLRQLRIAETEKYAHVTFFFNGGREEVFAQESRIMVPSPKVATYDLQPEMSADEVTNHVVAAIENATHDVIIVNYANTDMVGHSGNFSAAVKAVEAVDSCIARITLALEKAGGAMLLTADHGNAECMHDEQSKQAHTQHTLNVVPFVALHPKLKHVQQNLPVGTLADIAPTALYVLGIAAPQVMTGKNLLQEYLQ